MYPADALAPPYSEQAWYHVSTPHVTHLSYNAATRTLRGVVQLAPTEDSMAFAKRQLAEAYRAHGQRSATDADMVRHAMPLRGCGLGLGAGDRKIPRHGHAPAGGDLSLGPVPFVYVVPAGNDRLHEQLLADPEHAALEFRGMHDYQLVSYGAATVQLLQSSFA